ncbi:MAG: sn-glycerol-3-phosphate import ATP-binding protein UgpC [Alphaproteobacteria bacterium]
MADIRIDNVTKKYGDAQVLHGISIAIADGEFVVIVGPSGCGKSTLLRMVAGLERITTGDISIAGRVVNEVEPMDRDIAMVFQNYALYPHMTVFNNMAYGLRNRKVAKDQIQIRVDEAAKILSLEELLDRLPRQLSGGQRQRVAMGRAIVRKPSVFLFDEPLSNLDAKLRVQMRVETRKLQKRLGVTALYVTHDQVEAMTMADRLVVMNAGRAEQIGAPMDIYEKPETVFVAGFIGSPAMNFLKGSDHAGALVLAGGAKIARPKDLSANSAALTIGIRPEHLTRVAAKTADFQLTIDLVEPLGADTIIYGRAEGVDDELVVRVSGKAAVELGAVMPVKIDADQVHVFDAKTGRRVS